MISSFELRRRSGGDGEHLPSSLPPLLRRIYAQRGVVEATELEQGVANLLDYRQLSGIEQAVQLLQKTLVQQQSIIVVGDFDADGATSTALALRALRLMGASRTDFLVPNRFDDGYGLTPTVVEQAARKGAELIITVDNGISSHEGIQLANAKGIKVLVTDHHLPGEQLPPADAIVNPNQHCCSFPSKALAGVGVIFYLMLALRAELRRQGWFERQALSVPNLAELLDLVALGTVADVVPLDKNNRILVHQGLSRIRAGQCCPGIKALLEIAKREQRQLVASDLGFFLAPRLNAAGRLDDMSIGIALLLCNDMVTARELAYELDGLNRERKEIEQGMQNEALHICQQLEQQSDELPVGLALYHPQWHQGVIGILASRIKERFHRPVVAFAPAEEQGMLKGSGRSVTGLHMRDILERLDTLCPGLIHKFGGHAMAAGLTIAEQDFDQFRHSFAELVTEYLTDDLLTGTIWSDGELTSQQFSLETAGELRYGGPWGQAFPEPLFDGKFHLLQQRLVGEKHLKVLLEPLSRGPLLEGIAFNVDTSIWPDNSIRQVQIAYRLDINEFRGNRNVQLVIEHIWPE